MNEAAGQGFEAPRSVEQALALLAKHGAAARVLAGGTDLLAQMKSGARRPGWIVDLKRIPELMQLRETDAGVVIGAAVPAVTLREHPALRARYPGLAEAMALIGSEQIQGRASLGGNLCNASPAADTTPALLVNDAEVKSDRVCVTAGAPFDVPGTTNLLKVEVV
jgi:carbon-monoxide dehydrogenase medium subunit